MERRWCDAKDDQRSDIETCWFVVSSAAYSIILDDAHPGIQRGHVDTDPLIFYPLL